jgi:hypothetical protein
MVETRIAPRYRVNKPATVEYRGTRHVCTVRDLSISGAALQFSVLIRSLCIPNKFILIIPEDGLNLPCSIVWHRDFRIGVAFD